MEGLGYIGAICLVYAFYARNILRSRCINFAGWIIIGVYGVAIAAMPIVLLSVIFALYNIYCFFWIRIGNGKKLFKLLFDATFYGLYSKDFIDYHKGDLVKYYPEVDFEKLTKKADKSLNCCFVFHETTPIGMFVYKTLSEDTAEVIVDYTDPKYASLIEACFLTRGRGYLKKNKGIRTLITHSTDSGHNRYLKKQGFVPIEGEPFKFVLDI